MARLRISIGQTVLRCEHSAIWVGNRDMARSDRVTSAIDAGEQVPTLRSVGEPHWSGRLLPLIHHRHRPAFEAAIGITVVSRACVRSSTLSGIVHAHV